MGGLRLQLGHAPGPLHHHHHQTRKQSESPSRQQRRARRPAARADIVDAENATKPHEAEVVQQSNKVFNLEVKVAEVVTPDKNVILPAAIAWIVWMLYLWKKTERGLDSQIGQSDNMCISQLYVVCKELKISFTFESEYATDDDSNE